MLYAAVSAAPHQRNAHCEAFEFLDEMFYNWLTFRCRVQKRGGLTYTQERAQLVAQQAAQMCTKK